MASILVIEDETDLQEVLRYNLELAGHRAVVASTGASGLALLGSESIELVLLDLMLPDMTGTEVCRRMRYAEKSAHVPIIILTARGEEVDRVVGFEMGADDYVTKPFSVRELMLRVDAVLRRNRPVAPSGEQIEFGVLRIDLGAHRVWVEDKETDLSALEFKLLVTLYQRKNRVQARHHLLNEVWGIHADITTRTVDTHVKRLREKLGAARAYVQTVRGVGYRFVDRPPPPGVDLPLESDDEA